MAPWLIWQAGPEEQDDLVRIEAAAFGAKSWGENNVRASFVAPRVTILLAAPKANLLQKLTTQKPSISERAAAVGFAMWRDLGPEAEILSVGVEPATMGQGAGGALLSACLEGARATGAKKIYLEVDEGNQAAQALYEGARFEKISVRRSYYRDGAHALVMQRAL